MAGETEARPPKHEAIVMNATVQQMTMIWTQMHVSHSGPVFG